MLRQIKYFQAVVRNNSFSEAAEECHISQSAISQQIKALERELGFHLFERKNRNFILTPAGAYFYQKTLIWVADYEQLSHEAMKIAQGDKTILKIGYLRHYNGKELPLALEEFLIKYPHVSIQFLCGNHEELFYALRSGTVDLVCNDQRRAFSDEYNNLILTTSSMYIAISSRNTLSALPSVTTPALKNIPCILIASKEQRILEQEYYQTVIGFQGEFLYTENLEEAHLLVISGQGFLPVDTSSNTISPVSSHASICHIPLYRGHTPMTRNYCLFWKKDNSGYYIEEFADILKNQFL